MHPKDHLTKAVSLYALEATQHASGETLGKKGEGSIVAAMPAIGDSQSTTPADTPTQRMLDIGVAIVF